MPWIAREHLRPCLRGEQLRSPSDHFPAGGDLQYMGLGVVGRRHVAAHVQHADLRCPFRPVRRPAGRCPEDPCQVPACLLEVHSVTVECVGEADVMKHRRDIEEFLVEGDAVRCAVHRSPEVRADAVVE